MKKIRFARPGVSSSLPTLVLSVLLSVGMFVFPQTSFASSLFQDNFDTGSGELHAYNSNYVNFCTRYGSNNGTSDCGEMDIYNGQLEVLGHDTGYLYTAINGADMCSSIDFNWHNSGGGWASVIVRGDNSGDIGDEFQARSDGVWSYYHNGGFDNSGPLTIDTTIPHNVKVCASGTTVTGYIDGVLYATETDATNTTGNPGFGFQYPFWTTPDQHTMDNFIVTDVHVNAPPVVGSVSIIPNPAEINTSVTATTTFTDPDIGQTHTATADWGISGHTADSCSVTESTGAVSCTLPGGYALANVYPVTIAVSDGTALTTSAVSYASVYNPTQSSIFSAGSNYNNPTTASPSTSGKVKVGLSYKYQGGVATGDKQFSMDFDAANLHFNASTVSSLVITSGTAILQGTGTLNGNAGYNFVVTGIDSGGIRIQITDSSSNVVYDTQPGNPITTPPATDVIGHVVVH